MKKISYYSLKEKEWMNRLEELEQRQAEAHFALDGLDLSANALSKQSGPIKPVPNF